MHPKKPSASPKLFLAFPREVCYNKHGKKEKGESQRKGFDKSAEMRCILWTSKQAADNRAFWYALK